MLDATLVNWYFGQMANHILKTGDIRRIFDPIARQTVRNWADKGYFGRAEYTAGGHRRFTEAGVREGIVKLSAESNREERMERLATLLNRLETK